MAEARTNAPWSGDTVLNEATWYSAAPKACVSHAQPSPPQARGVPLEPNPFHAPVDLIDDARITYPSSRRDLRDREGFLAGHNREKDS